MPLGRRALLGSALALLLLGFDEAAARKKARRARRGAGGGGSSPRGTTDGDCPCNGGAVCVGPRGGRYCITSGGRKRYGV